MARALISHSRTTQPTVCTAISMKLVIISN
jgi:hypothetical protein